MSTTKHYYKEMSNLSYYPNIEFFSLDGVGVEVLKPGRYTEDEYNQAVEMFENQEKIVLRLNLSFFHLFWDTISNLLYLYKIYPEHKYIFICENAKVEEFTTRKHVIFFLQLLQKLKIDYYIHSQNEYGFFKAKKCYMINHDARLVWANRDCIPNIKKELNILLNIKNIEPFRKCYLSRVKYHEISNSQNRIENEKEIEKFFKRNGFEIIYPEDFATMEDQIKYFNEVKVVAGVTGSGLTNIIFMQKDTNVIELSVVLEVLNQPILGQDLENLVTEVAQHHFYQAISFLKNQSHFCIPLNYFNNYILNKRIFLHKRKLKKYNLDLLFFGN